MPVSTFTPLNVAIIGAGLTGLSAAIALRRSGHTCTIYERRDLAAEVGNSISCAKNGGQWLHEWGVDVPSGLPIDLQVLTLRDYKTGDPDMVYDLSNYEAKWGYPYYMFHRQDMHAMLLNCAVSEEGEGPAAKLICLSGAQEIDFDSTTVTFTDGTVATFDMVVGADGVVSTVRKIMKLDPTITSASSSCYRCNVYKDKIEELGLHKFAEPAIQYWGGLESEDINKYLKIVMSPCNGGEVISFYTFFPAELARTKKEGFVVDDISIEELTAPFGQLDPDCLLALKHSVDRKPWRLYVHAPLTKWTEKKVALLGDACHAMMPHQSQGACQGIEDAAALGVLFSKDYRYTQNIEEGLKMYEKIRKPRAERVQYCSFLATEDIRERIGFSSLPGSKTLGAIKPKEGHVRLTIEEINGYDMKADINETVPAQFKA
ncbi:hypothetical protein BCR39DRAFT_485094 [Naematelia encephala]|uniref:FAD-binding domain-containing protein n=1 Tax=Naematelia encephala TaxID=71784 RepID=A0A1Y2ATL6_9TREE|nr:hypothetical protein BCR39DRAFT_485094 [Naematelia encephala]